MPRLSVVIPTRDTRDLTLRCLECFLRLDPGVEDLSVETVVVDEASRDGTAEAVRERFPEIRTIVREEPAGFAAAANEGLRAASGELLLLLNSDTEVDAGALAALLQAFDADPRLGIAGARLRYPDGSPQWSGGGEPGLLWLFGLATGLPAALGKLGLWRRLRPPAGSQAAAPEDAPRSVAWVTGAALALRREVWERCGPLDEGYRFYAQDLDLCSRARDAGSKVAIVPGFTVLHHHGATLAAAGARGQGDEGFQRFDLLWPDLVRWRRKAKGCSAGRSAARALAWGGILRLLARRLATPFAAVSLRRRWNQETVHLQRAIAACSDLSHRSGPS